MLDNARSQLARRGRQTRTMLRDGDVGHLGRALRRKVVSRLAEGQTELFVRPADVLAVDLGHPSWVEGDPVAPGDPLVVNWVMAPPSPRSGGHATEFRLIRDLMARGHTCRVYFYDMYNSDHAYYESIVRDHFRFTGELGNVDDGMKDAHAILATYWATAYAIFASPAQGKRFYFVQDFEPSFYAMSSNYALAENTYQMGFHGVTAGRWLSEMLTKDYGMPADHFDFGCDVDVYRLDPGVRRDGVVFYARPSAPRRGTEIGLMALELFARRHPEITIHTYGERIKNLGFPATQHGTIPPSELSTIYNQCFAGLSLSLTNVSLVPHEMLAAGCIPVVNEAHHNRVVLDNEHVHYAGCTPQALADALSAVVTTPDFAAVATTASASVGNIPWERAGDQVEAILRRELTRE